MMGIGPHATRKACYLKHQLSTKYTPCLQLYVTIGDHTSFLRKTESRQSHRSKIAIDSLSRVSNLMKAL